MVESAASARPPWDQLPGESRQAYAAFLVYRDLPSNVRTADLAYWTAKGRPENVKAGKRAGGQWTKWPAPDRYNWLDRAKAYDQYLRQQADAAEAEEVRRTGRERARRREQVEESEWTARGRLLSMAERMLDYPLETVEEVDDEPEARADGVFIIRRIIHRPIRWSMADVSKFYEMASRLGRLSTGAETERATVVTEDGTDPARGRAGGALTARLQRALAQADAGKRERILAIYGRLLRDTRELEDALIALETGAPPRAISEEEEEEEDGF
jgi:hypothetical protein